MTMLAYGPGLPTTQQVLILLARSGGRERRVSAGASGLLVLFDITNGLTGVCNSRWSPELIEEHPPWVAFG